MAYHLQPAQAVAHVSFTAESGHHGVQFYADDAFLCDVVAGFLFEGLKTSRPAIVIATPAHRAMIADELKARAIDVDHCVRTGALHLLDAKETLARFMVNGMPDAGRFHAAIGPLLREAAGAPHPRMIRAYGEMVDVLWQAGNIDAAIHLEVIWNELAMTHNFALLCGYSEHHVPGPLSVQNVCNQHTHVLSARSSRVA